MANSDSISCSRASVNPSSVRVHAGSEGNSASNEPAGAGELAIATCAPDAECGVAGTSLWLWKLGTESESYMIASAQRQCCSVSYRFDERPAAEVACARDERRAEVFCTSEHTYNEAMYRVEIAAGIISVVIWVYLLCGRGKFWSVARAQQC